ncbi:hypothetical protein CSAL01_11414 [Colletotrichum salicis]|uniref:NACHT domain-containing protein n=1 Tax=Colletotrichum salicis TaxID=1209931 RepID=A0A135TBW0_9PEZI|nr:hypothetical protein CSAL01_11414 [Colletotrichum salicis]
MWGCLASRGVELVNTLVSAPSSYEGTKESTDGNTDQMEDVTGWTRVVDPGLSPDPATSHRAGLDKLEILDDILAAAVEKNAESLRKRWKFTRNGKTYIGDIAIQYDPAHAALPWAVIRFFLQATVDNEKAFGIVCKNMSHIANIIARSAILEDLYLGRYFPSSRLLEQNLVRIYARILGYLSAASKYYSTSTLGNFSEAVFKDSVLTQSIQDILDMDQKDVDRCAFMVNTEIQEMATTALGQEHSRQMQVLRGILPELEAPITRVSTGVAQLVMRDQGVERAAILKSLSTVPYPSHHQNACRGRLNGSGEWLLKHRDFIHWRGSSYSSVFWLDGIPGCGKTKLCSMAVRIAYEIMQDEGFGENLTEVECGDMLVDATKTFPSLTIVIDAVDECDEDERTALIHLLKRVRDKSENLVKILISSRDDIDIMTSLADAVDKRIRADDNADGINRFVYQKVGALMDLRDLKYGIRMQGFREEIISVLTSKAQGMFRWVDIQLETLKWIKLDEDLRTQLGQLADNLNDPLSPSMSAILFMLGQWKTYYLRNQTERVSPETLNWPKDHDVTWLYGPFFPFKSNFPMGPRRPLRILSPAQNGGPLRSELKVRSLASVLGCEDGTLRDTPQKHVRFSDGVVQVEPSNQSEDPPLIVFDSDRDTSDPLYYSNRIFALVTYTKS